VSQLEPFARRDVRQVLKRFGIENARRATPRDPTEEVFMLGQVEYDRIDPDVVATALMEVLPHTKIWVVADGPWWTGEAI
jgi:hypothetical protein